MRTIIDKMRGTATRAVLIAAMLISGLCSMGQALPAGKSFNQGNFLYTVTDAENRCVSIKVKDNNAKRSLPAELTISGYVTNEDITYTVTSIAASAFTTCTNLKKVTLPESITSIGEKGFYNSYNIIDINFPEGITEIGDEAFNGCEVLTQIDLPSSLASIGDKAFYGCHAIVSVIIPNSVTSIGSMAFEASNALKDVTVHNNTPFNLGNDVFRYTAVASGSLYVPQGSEEAYRTNSDWNNIFSNIVGISTEIVDKTDYAAPDVAKGITVKYTRTFANDNWQALYVPFKPSVDAMGANVWGEGFEFAKLYSVETVNGGEVMHWVSVTYDQLEAGKPYIVRYTGEPNSDAATEMYFYQGADDWAAAYQTTDPVQTASSANYVYNLYGNPNTQNVPAGYYALSGGQFRRSTGNNSLSAQRFYLSITPTGSQAQAPAQITVKVDGDEAGVIFPEVDQIIPIDDLYYDLQGLPVASPQPGRVYIHHGQKIVI